jgi:adenylate cyclase class 2
MIEIERKFRLSTTAAQKIKQKLEEKYGNLETIHQVDKVFLLGIDSFKDFTVGMPVVRLRTEGSITKLTYKRAINDSGDSLEHELGVESAQIMEAILLETDFRVVTSVVKDRIEVSNGDFTYALDHVEKLGDFIEIEVVTEDPSQLHEIEKRIMVAADELELSEADIENKKYDQLIAALS